MVDAAICDGDWVVVRQQNVADNGDIVAAMIDGEATVKTFKRTAGHVWLMPHNPVFDPIPGDNAAILGKGRHGHPQNLTARIPIYSAFMKTVCLRKFFAGKPHLGHRVVVEVAIGV